MRGVASAVAPLNLGAFVQVQLDLLEDELKLAPAQRGAWTAYAERVGKFADDVVRSQFEARAAGTAQATGTAPEQLGQIADRMRSRLLAVDEIVLGTAFYATLTRTEGGRRSAAFADGRDTDHKRDNGRNGGSR
jgi:hypothetical protein